MSEEHKATYKSLKTDSARRELLASFVLDPTVGVSKGFNMTCVEKTDLQTTVGRWMHQSEIAGPDGLNDPSLAKVVCESGDLEEREYPALAAAGEKQFWFSKDAISKTIGTKKRSGVENTAELTPDEYKVVQASM